MRRQAEITNVRPKFIDIFRSERAKRVYVPLLLFATWLLITECKLVKPLFLPSPLDIVRAYRNLWFMLPKATLVSVTMIIAGFVLGAVVGIGIGLAMAYSELLLDAFGAIFDFLRPVPVFALIPLFILWFGVGRAPQIALIALGVSVTLGVTTMEAIRNMPSIYVHAGYTLGACRKDIFKTIVVPYIIPHLVGAIRVAAAASFGLDVAAEFMGSQEGLGYLMIVQQQYLKTDGIIAIVIIYSILAFILDKIIGRLERWITEWTEREVDEATVGL